MLYDMIERYKDYIILLGSGLSWRDIRFWCLDKVEYDIIVMTFIGTIRLRISVVLSSLMRYISVDEHGQLNLLIRRTFLFDIRVFILYIFLSPFFWSCSMESSHCLSLKKISPLYQYGTCAAHPFYSITLPIEKNALD